MYLYTDIFYIILLTWYIILFFLGEITLQHSTLTEAEFDNIVAEWLRFGKQRKEREEKGKHDENLQINEEN